LFHNLLILLAILVLFVEIYRILRQIWLHHLLSQKKKARRPRKPPVLRPKSERECRICKEDKQKRKTSEREAPLPWELRKGKGGPKKKIAKEGNFCSNESCEYCGIAN